MTLWRNYIPPELEFTYFGLHRSPISSSIISQTDVQSNSLTIQCIAHVRAHTPVDIRSSLVEHEAYMFQLASIILNIWKSMCTALLITRNHLLEDTFHGSRATWSNKMSSKLKCSFNKNSYSTFWMVVAMCSHRQRGAMLFESPAQTHELFLKRERWICYNYLVILALSIDFKVVKDKPSVYRKKMILGLTKSSPKEQNAGTNGGAEERQVETPLDLSRSMDEALNKCNETQGRKRSRKGKAYKIDALCLKLQNRMDTEEDEKAEIPRTVRAILVPFTWTTKDGFSLHQVPPSDWKQLVSGLI